MKRRVDPEQAQRNARRKLEDKFAQEKWTRKLWYEQMDARFEALRKKIKEFRAKISK